jgi:hypothetical protein
MGPRWGRAAWILRTACAERGGRRPPRPRAPPRAARSVGVRGDGDGGVPEHLRHRLEVSAAGQCQGCGAVPEVVQPDRWQPAVSSQSLEVPGDVLRVQCRVEKSPGRDGAADQGLTGGLASTVRRGGRFHAATGRSSPDDPHPGETIRGNRGAHTCPYRAGYPPSVAELGPDGWRDVSGLRWMA